MVYQLPGMKIPGPIAEEFKGKSLFEKILDSGVPRYMRLQIPMTDPRSLRYVADILRKLANDLDLQARIPEGDELKAAKAAWWDIKAANRRISEFLQSSQATKSSGPESL